MIKTVIRHNTAIAILLTKYCYFHHEPLLNVPKCIIEGDNIGTLCSAHERCAWLFGYYGRVHYREKKTMIRQHCIDFLCTDFLTLALTLISVVVVEWGSTVYQAIVWWDCVKNCYIIARLWNWTESLYVSRSSCWWCPYSLGNTSCLTRRRTGRKLRRKSCFHNVKTDGDYHIPCFLRLSALKIHVFTKFVHRARL